MTGQFAIRIVSRQCPGCGCDLGQPAAIVMDYDAGKSRRRVTTRREITGHVVDLPRARPVFRGKVTGLSCAGCDVDLDPVVQLFQHTSKVRGPAFEEDHEFDEDDEPETTDEEEAWWREIIDDLDDAAGDWTGTLPFEFSLDIIDDDDEE